MGDTSSAASTASSTGTDMSSTAGLENRDEEHAKSKTLYIICGIFVVIIIICIVMLSSGSSNKTSPASKGSGDNGPDDLGYVPTSEISNATSKSAVSTPVISNNETNSQGNKSDEEQPIPSIKSNGASVVTPPAKGAATQPLLPHQLLAKSRLPVKIKAKIKVKGRPDKDKFPTPKHVCSCLELSDFFGYTFGFEERCVVVNYFTSDLFTCNGSSNFAIIKSIILSNESYLPFASFKGLQHTIPIVQLRSENASSLQLCRVSAANDNNYIYGIMLRNLPPCFSIRSLFDGVQEEFDESKLQVLSRSL